MALSPRSGWRDGALARVNARYQAFLEAGFPTSFGEGETLQCRNELDRTNWLALKDICQEAVFAEAGDLPIPEPGLRTSANNFFRPTFAECLELMRDLRTWALVAQANWWRLKDSVRAAETRQELDAIDLEAGWP